MSSISRKVKTQRSKGAQPFLESALAEFEMGVTHGLPGDARAVGHDCVLRGLLATQ